VVIAAMTPACSCSCVADAVGSGPPTEIPGGGGGWQGAMASGGGEGGEDGPGGAGGARPASRPEASEVVAAGGVAKSPRYRMVFTLGQPTQNQEKTTSRKYRMRGGLIGASESAPSRE
jgi:hypothetical protein